MLLNIANNFIKSNIFNKSIENTALNPKQAKFHLDLVVYYNSLTPSCKAVLLHLFSFRKKNWISIKNETIAKALGYSVRQIQRATKKFQEDGLIQKSQSNIYSVNNYKLNPILISGNKSFLLWLNTLDVKQRDIYLAHGETLHANRNYSKASNFKDKNQPMSYRLLSNNNLYIKTQLDRVENRGILIGDLNSYLDPRFLMFSDAQKSWLLRTANICKIKEVLDAFFDFSHKLSNGKMDWDKVKQSFIALNHKRPECVTIKSEASIQSNFKRPKCSTIKFDIAQRLEFSLSDFFKLFVFTEKTLLHVYTLHGNIFTKNSKISDPIGYLFSLCVKYSKESNIPLDWRVYYKLNEIYGVERNIHTAKTKPSLDKGKSKEVPKLDMYKLVVNKPIESHQEAVIRLEKEVANWIKEINNLEASQEGINKYIVSFMKARLKSDMSQLEELYQVN